LDVQEIANKVQSIWELENVSKEAVKRMSSFIALVVIKENNRMNVAEILNQFRNIGTVNVSEVLRLVKGKGGMNLGDFVKIVEEWQKIHHK
jgi:hypothetical protein